jgi:hypothetical protein
MKNYLILLEKDSIGNDTEVNLKKIKSLMKNDSKSIIEKFSNNNVLVIAFGGIKQKIGYDLHLPPFEFVNTLSKKGTDVLFIRDLNQCWYQLGIDNLGNSITDVEIFLKKKIKNYDFVILIGTSMGGYASLLFSQLIKADVSITFSPQTFIDPINRKNFNDSRWEKQMKKFHKLKQSSNYYDLKNFFNNQNQINTKNYIFYGSEDKLDSLHAKRMKDFNSFYIFEVKNSPHNSAQKLKDEGIIDPILDFLIKNKSSQIPTRMFPQHLIKSIN